MSERSYRKELITCFGMPIDENPTIVIMDAAFQAMGLDYLYDGVLVQPEDLGDAVRAIKALHLKGSNVTVPHKVAVMEHLDHIEPDAALIGAVNTIYVKDGETWGANTDGKGFVTALREADLNPQGKTFVLLGAGGAAKAIAVELALAKAKKLTIVNRTLSKAQALAELINEKTDAEAHAVAWDHTYAIPADTEILVNCTNIGLSPDPNVPDVDFTTLRPETVVCDVIPNPPQTKFLQQAAAQGCRTLDGLSMLVNQGVIGLKIWTGQDAPAEIMKAALAEAFAE